MFNKGDIVCVWMKYIADILEFPNNPRVLMGFGKIEVLGIDFITVKFVGFPYKWLHKKDKDRIPKKIVTSFLRERCSLLMKAKCYSGQDGDTLFTLTKLTYEQR